MLASCPYIGCIGYASLITWIPADEERLCGNAAVIIVIVIIVIIIKLLFIYVSCMAFSCTEGNSPQQTML